VLPSSNTRPLPPIRPRKAYSNSHYRHVFIGAFYGFLILLVILRWRVAPAFRNLAERASSSRFVQRIIFAPLILFTIAVLGIPSDIWDESLQRAYGLSVQTWGAWTRDWILGQAIMLIVGTLLVAFSTASFAAAAPLVVLLLARFHSHRVADVLPPAHRRRSPLLHFQAARWRAARPRLGDTKSRPSRRHGNPRRPHVRHERQFETTGLNAYVTGFGASKRVVVWDNTIAKATVPETLFVFGHEMGHYVLLHIPKEMAIISAILLSCCIWATACPTACSRDGRAVGNSRLAGLGLAPGPALRDHPARISCHAGFQRSQPPLRARSRSLRPRSHPRNRRQSTRSPPTTSRKRREKSIRSRPSEFVKIWFFDHPTRPERVHFVATYNPWSSGEEPKYVK